MKHVMSIEWHEATLKTFEENMERERLFIAERQRHIARWIADVAFRKRQIAKAKAMGKTSYDAERFLGGFKY